MDEKLIIDALIDGVKNGKFTVEQVPENYREKVKEVVTNEN